MAPSEGDSGDADIWDHVTTLRLHPSTSDAPGTAPRRRRCALPDRAREPGAHGGREAAPACVSCAAAPPRPRLLLSHLTFPAVRNSSDEKVIEIDIEEQRVRF